jgi:hypothetical protein
VILLLAILSALAVVAFLLVLATFAIKIAVMLESIGHREPSVSHKGKMSFLSKISLGVRAIEGQCSSLAPQATKLNKNLPTLANALVAVRDRLTSIRTRVQEQKG